MLWAWETPEDLRELDPARAGVAFLERELLFGERREVRLRHQPLLLPPNVFLMPVVRVETSVAFHWRRADLPSIAAEIVQAAQLPHTRALQLDFDARASERPFYSDLLREVRRQLQPGVSLSVTALTSWCAGGSWLHGLPLDEAVPMFFRMGGPGSVRATAPRDITGVEEPLCTGSAGVATDEIWPSLNGNQRVYIFRVGSWRKADIDAINAGHLSQLQTAGQTHTQGPHP